MRNKTSFHEPSNHDGPLCDESAADPSLLCASRTWATHNTMNWEREKKKKKNTQQNDLRKGKEKHKPEWMMMRLSAVTVAVVSQIKPDSTPARASVSAKQPTSRRSKTPWSHSICSAEPRLATEPPNKLYWTVVRIPSPTSNKGPPCRWASNSFVEPDSRTSSFAVMGTFAITSLRAASLSWYDGSSRWRATGEGCKKWRM